MILDAIIALFGSLIGSLAQGVTIVFASIVNAVLAAIEAVVGLVVDGFSLGRMGRKEKQAKGSPRVGVAIIVLILGVLAWIALAPKVLNRRIALVAEDGHSLPFAGLTIHTASGDRHIRTDNAGNVTVPRFNFKSITVKDPRYIEKTWQRSEVEKELVVQRTVLGSGLDKIADKLLKPAPE